MPLVSYESSSSSEDSPLPETTLNTLKRKRARKDRDATLPALPATFHDLYASAARVSTHDDPTLHGGRKRALPHVEGQWPSHVFLEWIPRPVETTLLNRLLAQLSLSCPTCEINSLVTSPLGVPLPLHISLSAPISLATDQRGPFLASLKETMGRTRPFTVSLNNLKWFPNEERTRWFLVLGIERPGGDELNALLKACNKVADRLGLKGLYTDNTHGKSREDYTTFFHFSVAWSLTAPPSEAMQIEHLPVLESVMKIVVELDTVKVKLGDTVTSLALAVHLTEGKGILV